MYPKVFSFLIFIIALCYNLRIFYSPIQFRCQYTVGIEQARAVMSGEGEDKADFLSTIIIIFSNQNRILFATIYRCIQDLNQYTNAPTFRPVFKIIVS